MNNKSKDRLNGGKENVLLELNSERGNRYLKRHNNQLRTLAISLTLIFVVFCVCMMTCMVAESVYIYTGVEGQSMQPTINEDVTDPNTLYDYVYVNTFQKGTYGDIIVVEHRESTSVKYVIKRLIGLAGDTITFDNTDPNKTLVYRNGELLYEPYLDIERNSKFTGLYAFGEKSAHGITEITIPNGCVFYMGDNRNRSQDCRAYISVGANGEPKYCESVKNIVGRVDYIVPHENVDKGDGKGLERFWRGIKEVFGKVF